MKKKLCALAAALCLLLTACGGEEKDEVSFLGKAAGMEENATLITVDGRDVPAWRYLYWLADTCDGILAQYDKAGAQLDWAAPVAEGTLADYARQQALTDTALYATVENWAEKYGCKLEEADRTALDADWAEKTKDGEEAVLTKLRSRGLDHDRADTLASVGKLYARLDQLCRTPGSALAPKGNALKAYAKEHRQLTLDRILVAGKEDREAARQRAADLFSQLNSAQDQASLFAALSAAGDDPEGPRTVTLGEGALDPALEEAAAALQEGQCSGILESEEGFSILRRLPLDTAVILGAYFDEQLENAAENASIQKTEQYGQIDVAKFFQNLQELRKTEDD